MSGTHDRVEDRIQQWRSYLVNRDAIAPADVDELEGHLRDQIDGLAASASLWERRVAVLATFAFIRAGDGDPILRLAPRLLGDREDLIHKAVGWMLRELGARVDRSALIGFLDEYAQRMPRTMLSYATEHLDPEVGCRLDAWVASGESTPERLAAFRRLMSSRSGAGEGGSE